MTAAPGVDAGAPSRPERPQAVIRIVPHGGAKTARQIREQWKYLSRKGQIPLQRSERYFGIPLPDEELEELAASWIEQTGVCPDDHDNLDEAQELTTHIVISFPQGTDLENAFAAGRAWAEKMFGSGENGGSFDYLTACHSDRPHPHVHLVVNRRALEGHWLKISRRHAYLSYEKLRAAIVDVASGYGIALEASSRLDRGITEPAITYAQYRRQARQASSESDSGNADGTGPYVRRRLGGIRKGPGRGKAKGGAG